MQIAITGGRDQHLSLPQAREFVRLLRGNKHINGGARGVDRDARTLIFRMYLAETRRGREVTPRPAVFDADWKTHGKAAGHIRNRLMLDCSQAVIVCAGGRGTMNCFAQAVKLRVPIIDFRGLGNQ